MEMPPPGQESIPVRKAKNGTGVLARLDRGIVLLSTLLLWIAGAGLVGMPLLIVADVIGIKILSNPVPGGIELVTFFAVIAIAFAVAYTQAMRGHVAVDFVAA
jgi:TRAP-type C4-dicarboxylate transport system permease small subunit